VDPLSFKKPACHVGGLLVVLTLLGGIDAELALDGIDTCKYLSATH
jgi:hypothetical protein